jgi:hypothetical protein
MTDKVEYVRKAKQTRAHTCHWPKCGKQVPPAMWGCSFHWFKLPANLRREVWAAYVPGQEVTMTPSERYLEVARKVEEWIAANENK